MNCSRKNWENSNSSYGTGSCTSWKVTNLSQILLYSLIILAKVSLVALLLIYIGAIEKMTDSLSISSSAKDKQFYWQLFHLPHRMLACSCVYKAVSILTGFCS